MDDIIITGSNEAEIQRLKGVLSTKFQVKELGKLALLSPDLRKALLSHRGNTHLIF